MLHILLLILKIIGIVLAVLLGLTILILIVPVSYKGKGDSKEETKFQFVARGLLSLIYFKFSWVQDDMKYVFRIFGIPVLRGVVGEEEEGAEEEEISDEELGGLFSNFEDNIVVKLSKEEQEANFLKREEQQNHINEEEYIELTADQPKRTGQDVDKGFESEKIKSEDSSFVETVKNIINFLKKLPKKVKDIKVKIQRLKKFLKSEKAKVAFYYSRDTVKKLYHHMKPSKFETNVIFGFESPDITGKVLAVLSVVYGTIKIDPEKFSITPDFQNKRLEGTIFLKGNFVPVYVLVQLIKWYFKKEVHDIIERFIG